MANIQTIKLRDEMFDNVRSGVKIATLRKGKRDYTTGKTILYGNNNCDYINVYEVIYKLLSEITDEDAQQEGYDCKEDLIKIMKHIYEDIAMDAVVTQVFFEYLSTPNKLKNR